MAPPNREIASYLSHVLLHPWLGPGKLKRALVFQSHRVQAIQDLRVPVLVDNLNALLHLLHLLPHQRFQGQFPSGGNLVLDLAIDGNPQRNKILSARILAHEPPPCKRTPLRW